MEKESDATVPSLDRWSSLRNEDTRRATGALIEKDYGAETDLETLELERVPGGVKSDAISRSRMDYKGLEGCHERASHHAVTPFWNCEEIREEGTITLT